MTKNRSKSGETMKTIKKGFALPTVLISSVVLLLILVTAVSATVAVRTGLQDQRYERMAQLAGEAGTAYGLACLEKNNGTVTWTHEKPLKPNTDCNGDLVPGAPEYVREEANLRTYFVVDPPFANSSLSGEGFVEVLRSSTGTAWRVWGTSVATAIGGSAVATPVGTSIEGYWTSPPVGYLLEDGSAVSRTDYAALFDVIGTTFGAGDGSTTFNLPDSRGKGSIALNDSDGSFDTIGETGGSKTQTLTEAQMPNHDHGGSTGSGSINAGFTTTSGSSGNTRILGGQDACCGRWSAVISGSSHSHSISGQGGGQAHNILDPYIVVTRAIKY